MDNRFESCDSRRLLMLLESEGDGGSSAPQEDAASPRLQTIPHIEGYEVQKQLGQGGMGAVWRAVQTSTRRQVALKVMNAACFGSGRIRLRFDREVELAARLEHPNIARIYDSGISGGLYYYAMELIDGTHLDDSVSPTKQAMKKGTHIFLKDVRPLFSSGRGQALGGRFFRCSRRSAARFITLTSAG